MADPLINSVVETLAVENAANRDVLVCLLALVARRSADPQTVFAEISSALSEGVGKLPEAIRPSVSGRLQAEYDKIIAMAQGAT
jgi:hypothetical protein